MERYEYLNGPPAPRMVAELAMRHDVLVKQLADAQATIEALQARVEALEGWQDGVVTAFREAPLEWSPDLGQGNIPSALPQIFKNMHDYATKLTQRTAELEAAKAIQAIDLKNNNAYREQVANLQAELERVRGERDKLQSEVDGWELGSRGFP